EVSEWAAAVAPHVRALLQLRAETVGAFGETATFHQLQRLCMDRSTVKEVETEFDLSASVNAARFEQLYQGLATDWTHVLECSNWAARFVQELGSELDQSTAAALLYSPLPTQDYERSLGEATK